MRCKEKPFAIFAGKSLNKGSQSQDSETSSHEETHRRSKSILKNKSDSSKASTDPESERLLSDSASGAAVSENGSVCKMKTNDINHSEHKQIEK